MPIFEYHCSECSKDFEYIVFGGKEPEACPSCNGENVKRLMSACGFISKGGGGETVSSSAGASSCAGCSTNSCAGCGH